ncbi:MAG: trypsin-like serine protease [Candidatus Promineifilaceae bacterium]|jgi:uncharacterized repeat protein (TIGR01451 family)
MCRKLFSICLLLFLLLIFPFTYAVLAAPDQPDIVGGEEALPGAWPWQVALISSDVTNLYDGQYCGAVLVDDFWVVTAAHCVEDADTADFEVALGVHNLIKPEANYQRIAPKDIFIHPDYDPYSYDSDIALIRLQTPALITEGEGEGLPVQPLVLVAPDAGSLAGFLATVTGWGNQIAQPDPGGYDYPATLQQVEVPIVSNEECNTAYGDPDSQVITENMLCAGYIYKGGYDSCYGDSGGPLVIQMPESEEWQLAGLVSWGYGCAYPGSPGVYTRISEFTNWVTEFIERPDVTISKSAGALVVKPGGTLDYNLLVTNDGAQIDEQLTLSDEIPTGTTVVPGSISGDGVLEEGIITWNITGMAVDGAFSADFSVLVDEDFLDNEFYFFDDMEGDVDVWSVAHDPDFAYSDWSVTSMLAHSGSYSWFAPNLDYIGDQYLILSVPGVLPEDMLLRFEHYYEIEAGYDGGVIEISTNGGDNWIDLGPDIIENDYDLKLYNSNVYYNPLAGRYAFSGYQNFWIQTVVDLGKYAGEEIQIRFRLGTDDFFGLWGWFVDDVQIGSNTVISNQVEVHGVISNKTETAVVSFLPTDYAYLPNVGLWAEYPQPFE